MNHTETRIVKTPLFRLLTTGSDLIDLIFFFRSVWYDAVHFPSSWRLDPTEGPGRVRCRLQRYHLDVDEKYLMEEYRGKSE